MSKTTVALLLPPGPPLIPLLKALLLLGARARRSWGESFDRSHYLIFSGVSTGGKREGGFTHFLRYRCRIFCYRSWRIPTSSGRTTSVIATIKGTHGKHVRITRTSGAVTGSTPTFAHSKDSPNTLSCQHRQLHVSAFRISGKQARMPQDSRKRKKEKKLKKTTKPDKTETLK